MFDIVYEENEECVIIAEKNAYKKCCFIFDTERLIRYESNQKTCDF